MDNLEILGNPDHGAMQLDFINLHGRLTPGLPPLPTGLPSYPLP